MDLQARIAAALSDFDDLLMQGVSIEAALEVAAVENGVSIEVLKARASRILPLEERRRRALEKVDLACESADRKEAEAIGSLFAAAYEATKQPKLIRELATGESAGQHAGETAGPNASQVPVANVRRRGQSGTLGQLKFDF